MGGERGDLSEAVGQAFLPATVLAASWQTRTSAPLFLPLNKLKRRGITPERLTDDAVAARAAERHRRRNDLHADDTRLAQLDSPGVNGRHRKLRIGRIDVGPPNRSSHRAGYAKRN